MHESKIKYSHLLFVKDPATFRATRKIIIDGKTFEALNIHTVSKLIIRKKREYAQQVATKFIVQSFQSKFNKLQLNAVDFIKAYVVVYCSQWRSSQEFYVPMASLCQSSGSGKSKSCTTVLKTTPGFYICFRQSSLNVPIALSDMTGYPGPSHFSKRILQIFNQSYIPDDLTDQGLNACDASTVGRCLKVVAECIKSYYVRLVRLVSDKMTSSTDHFELEKLIPQEIENISSNSFETYYQELKPCDGDICNDFLKASSKVGGVALVNDAARYIFEVLSTPAKCFTFDPAINQDNDVNIHKTKLICDSLINLFGPKHPFMFFLDEATRLDF